MVIPPSYHEPNTSINSPPPPDHHNKDSHASHFVTPQPTHLSELYDYHPMAKKNKGSSRSPRPAVEAGGPASASLTVMPGSIEPSRSPMPETEDRPPRGSIGHGLDDSVFLKNPVTNIDSSKPKEASSSSPSSSTTTKPGRRKNKTGGSKNPGKMEETAATLKDPIPFPGQFEADGSGPIYASPQGTSPSSGESHPGTENSEAPKEGEAAEIKPETKELAQDQIQPGDSGVNIGGDGHAAPHSAEGGEGKAPMVDEGNETTNPETKDKDTQASIEVEPEPARPDVEKQPAGSEGTSGTAELEQFGVEQDDFGYSPGKTEELGEEAGENPGASRARRRLSDTIPHHAAATHHLKKSHSMPGNRFVLQGHPELTKQQATGPVSRSAKSKPTGSEGTAETAEMQGFGIKKDDFAYNPGKSEELGEDAGETPGASRARRRLSNDLPHHGVPHHPKGPQASSASQGVEKTPVGSEGTAETAEMQGFGIEKDDFGYNPGKSEGLGEDAGENPGASQARRRLSNDLPHHGLPRQPKKPHEGPASAETRELRQVSVGSGDIGHNIGTEPPSGHSKKKHPETSAETQELRANHLARSDIGPQHLKASAETRELRHIGLGKNEIGYNPGKGDDRGRQEPGEHPPPREAEPRPQSWVSTSSGADSGTEELSHFDLSPTDIGFNVGRGFDPGSATGENPAASQIHRRLSASLPDHSAKSTQSPETQELSSIHLSKRDIGPQVTQASPETRELRHIELRRGEFGYNIGRGEESGRIRSDEDSTENPGAARARRRASLQSASDCGEERPNFGHHSAPHRRTSLQSGSDCGEERPNPGNHTAPRRRSSIELGIEPQINCAPRLSQRGERDAQVNNTLQSYLQRFLAERGSSPQGTISDYPKIHSSQAMEGAANLPMSAHDRAVLESEHRSKARKTTPQQPPPQQQPQSQSQSQEPSSDPTPGTAVTLEQLQNVLLIFKREILETLDHSPSSSEKSPISGNISQLGPRLGRIETDIEFIRKQISVPTTTTTTSSSAPITNGVELNGPPVGDLSARYTNASIYRRSGERKISWGMMGLGVMAALGLVAFGGMLESMRTAEKGWGDKVAEWLFTEGRGQKAVQ